MGTAGDYFSLFRDYQVEAKRWGVNIDLLPYSEDGKLIEAFDAGRCDMASMIGLRSRNYNLFTGSIDSPGTLEDYVEMRALLSLVNSPRLDKYMVSGNYEVVGVLPVGAGYAVVNDRSINGVNKAAGKRAAVPAWDKTGRILAAGIKATPVLLDLPQYGPAFSKGDADIIVIPLVLYKPMELDKAIARNGGGIVRRPLLQFTMQIVTRRDKFPGQFGTRSRDFIGHQVDHSLSIARNMENGVDSRNWIYAQRVEYAEWNATMQAICNTLVREGYLDRRMLSILRRIRCKSTADDPECKDINDQQALKQEQKL
jgi:hypothetical protein